LFRVKGHFLRDVEDDNERSGVKPRNLQLATHHDELPNGHIQNMWAGIDRLVVSKVR
jgi:hypothetical protein